MTGVLKLATAAALLVVVAVALGQTANGSNDLDADIARHMPQPPNYSFVALPDAPPPGDALVETAHYADDRRDGQLVLLEYPDFTFYACSFIPGVGANGSCDLSGEQVASTRRNGVETKFFLAVKDGEAVPTAAPAVRRWVRHANFELAPSWISDYARTQLAKVYQ